MRRPRMAVISAAVAVLATAGLIGAQMGVASAAPAAPAATPRYADAAALARFTDQEIDWHDCALDGEDEVGQTLDKFDGECAEITVPLSYTAPDGPTLQMAISRLRATKPDQRLGVLLVNPGGPGGSGLALPLLIDQAGPNIADRYDVIGFDPRFVGRSAPLDCEWPVSSSLRGAGPNSKTFARHVAFVKNLATLCGDQKALLPYASTRNVARDMDVLRAALDEKKISYLGYSYGTYLGGVYLELFGDRADKVVLDSNVDPDVYGQNLFAKSSPAMTAALKNWAAWAARRNGTYRLGTSTKQVLANIEVIRKATDKKALKLGKYTVDSHLLPLLLWVPDDSPEAFAEQAVWVKVLLAAAKGGKVTPPQILADTLDFVNSPDGSQLVSSQAAVLCADKPASRTVSTYFKTIEKNRKADPLYGPMVHNVGTCAFWPIRPLEAPTKIANTRPLLLLNTTGDTQTPLPGAQRVHKAMTGSKLVTLRGAFRHGVYLTGRSNCADRVVEHYLLDGALPRADVTCTTDRTTVIPSGLATSLTTVPLTADRTWPWQSRFW